MSTPELPARLRAAYDGYSPGGTPLEPGDVVRLGRRRRRTRRVRAVAVAAVALVAVGGRVALATVPPEGSFLSPVVAAIRGDHHPWMEVNGKRYVVRVVPLGPTERQLRIVRLDPDGRETDLGGPLVGADEVPVVGNAVSGQDSTVTFIVLPGGAHDVRVLTPGNRYTYEVSSMTVSDPRTGQRLVAVAIGAPYDALTRINGYTWLDAQGFAQQRDL